MDIDRIDCMEMGVQGVNSGLDGRRFEQHTAGFASNPATTPSRGGRDLSRDVLVMIQVRVVHPLYRTTTHCLFMGSGFLDLRTTLLFRGHGNSGSLDGEQAIIISQYTIANHERFSIFLSSSN